MIEFAISIFAFLCLLVATYTDFKSKSVPDNLVYGMIGGGVLLRLVQVLFYGPSSIYPTLVNLLVYVILGYVFYRLRAWADGDFGMFIGIALLLPQVQAPWPAYLSYLFTVAVAGSIYGLLYMTYLAFRPDIFKAWSKGIASPEIILSLVLAGIGAFFANSISLPAWVGFFLAGLIYPLTLVSKSLEKFMQRRVTPDELESGDWVLEDIAVGKNVLVPKDNPGLTRSQIEKIKELWGKGKIKNKILIKDGIPFIPVFLFAYVASYLWGDVTILLVTRLLSLGP